VTEMSPNFTGFPFHRFDKAKHVFNFFRHLTRS